MDKTTLSHYGWICIVIFILTVYIAIATPFGVFVTDSAKYMLQGLFDTKKTSMDAADIEIIENEFDDSWNGQWDENTPVQEDIFETSVAYALILDNGMGADTVPLVFTRSKTEIKVGDKYNSTTYGERTVVASFTGFEDIEYSYGNGGKTTAPWSTAA